MIKLEPQQTKKLQLIVNAGDVYMQWLSYFRERETVVQNNMSEAIKTINADLMSQQ